MYGFNISERTIFLFLNHWYIYDNIWQLMMSATQNGPTIWYPKCVRACISLFSIDGVNYKSSYMIIYHLLHLLILILFIFLFLFLVLFLGNIAHILFSI